jgi:proline dehydrogenase
VTFARKLLLAASTNAWIRDRAMKTPFVMRSVSRFMPGERMEDALEAAARQRRDGTGAIFTHLGENVATSEQAEHVTRHYLDVLDRASAAGLGAHISIKPTQLGLDLDLALCDRNLQRLVDRGTELNTLVWIDMEGSAYVDRTLDLFRRMRQRSPLVGVALQAYLYRTERDLESLLPLGAALRLVKGAYLEPAAVAYPRKSDVDDNYYRLAVRILTDSARPGALLHIATHDATLVDRLANEIEARRVPPSYYEYAMLYGIQKPLQHRLAAAGRRVRVLISYGEDWFPWYMRRLAERPANIWFVLKQVLHP